MTGLSVHPDQIIALCRRYGIPCESLEEIQQQYANFQMPVPLLGSCNTGKSSLLNALLGTRLLPTGLTAKTTVPTEIVFGDTNSLTACHTQYTRQLGLGDLRAPSSDFTGVHLLQAQSTNLFLEQIKRIRLVDTPGLDGRSREQEQSLRDYLPQSLAYILVFSADEPVIKESIANFLCELRLREIPVVPVLTKADKIPLEELDRARSFLEKSLRSMFLLDDISLCVVSARRDVEPLRRQLLRLQEKAGNLIDRALESKLREASSGLRAYLSLRMEITKLADSEAAYREAALTQRVEEVHRLLDDRLRLFALQSKECQKQILQRVETGIQDAAAPMETMLYSGNNPWEYTESMLHSTITAGFADSYQPLVHNFFKQLTALIKAHDVAPSLPDPVEGGPEPATLPGIKRHLHLPAQNSWDTLANLWELFEPVAGQRVRGPRRQALITRAVTEQIIPELCRRCAICIDEVLRQSAAYIEETADLLLSRQAQLTQKALTDIRQERTLQGEYQESPCLEDDWHTLQTALEACSPTIG